MILVLLVASTSFLATYILLFLTRKYKVIDIPNERSSHTVPTPRGGGLAIVLSWYGGITFLWFSDYLNTDLYLAMISGILLSIVSLFDDLLNIKPIVRLIIQVVTAILAIIFIGGFNLYTGIEDNPLLWLLTNIGIIIAIVWFINLFNFLDGIDGYASIEAIIVAMAMYFFTNNITLLIISAATLGFLIWNWPKAKIFMGDVGSTQLGFVLIILGIYFHNTQQFSIWYWIMITAVFWFDATITLFRRWRNKEKLSQAHRKHAYQRIVQSGFSHLKTDLYLIALNCLIIIFVYIAYKADILLFPLFIVLIVILSWLTFKIDKRKSF